MGIVVVAAIAAALLAALNVFVDETEPDFANVGASPVLTLAKEAMPLGISESFLEEKRRAVSDGDLVAQF
jgi:hypothetical protein